VAVATSARIGRRPVFSGNPVAQWWYATTVTYPSSGPVVELLGMTTPLPSCAVARLFGTTYNYYRSRLRG
jgi:hypothetical protein